MPRPTQKCHSVTRNQAGPSAPPSTMSATPATPATQNDRGCEFVPRLPREIKVDVTKCHACHAKVPRLCHACHVKSRWMSPSATPATQKCRGVTRDQAGPSHAPLCGCEIVPRLPREFKVDVTIVPRLPREIKVDVTKCHACHAKVPRRHARPSGPKRATQCHECHACHAKRR